MAMTALSHNDAMNDVRARVSASRSSFTAGMMVLPKERREAMFALYAFCRIVDDIADDGATLELRQQGLQEWRTRIADLFQRGAVSDSVTAILAPAIKKFTLAEADFQAIIDGMAMDAGDPIRAPDRKTLDLYCDRVASAVGRASVRIFGDSSARAMDVAHHLGRAFQLTNILRDIAEDAERGRLYLPEELLANHKIATRDPKQVLFDPALQSVCRDLAVQAGDHFAKADAAMDECIPNAMKPARLMRAYYGAIYLRLRANDWRNPTLRVRLSAPHKLWLTLRFLLGQS